MSDAQRKSNVAAIKDSQNLSIWNQVETTDPEFTKAYKGSGGFQGSSINAVYLTRKATELWGALGEGWGYEIQEDRYDQGAPLGLLKDADGNNTNIVIHASIHTIKLLLWYKKDGERFEVTHFGHTDHVYSNKYGIKTDSEAPKKSLTDAIKKCLSMLGFSADVFMGKFDDQEYVEEQRGLALIEKADNKAEEIDRQQKEFDKWFLEHSELLSTASNLNELSSLFKMMVRKLKARRKENLIIQVTKIKDQRKSTLEKDGK